MSHIARTKRGRVTPRLVVVANVVMVAWWTTLAVLVDLMLKICTFPLTFFRRNGSNGWSLLSEISRRCLLTSRTLKGKKMHVCAGDFLHYEDDVTGYRIIHFRRQIQKKSHEKRKKYPQKYGLHSTLIDSNQISFIPNVNVHKWVLVHSKWIVECAHELRFV